MTNLSHEGALARLHASRSPERIERDATMSRVHAAYVTMTRDDEILFNMNELISVSARHHQAISDGTLRCVGRLAEGRSFWLLGESGAGKTRSLERRFEKIPEFATYRTDPGSGPLISVQVPSPFTLRQFAQDLAAAAGFDTDLVLKENVAWSTARRLIRDRISFIHIDEAHNFLESNNPVEITKARNALRYLVTRPEWPVSLILSGLPHTEMLAKDFQAFRRRFVVRLLSINFERDQSLIRAAFVRFCELAGLAHRDVLQDAEILERLIYASAHQFGVCFELMHDAIMIALDRGSSALSLADFASAYRLRIGDSDSNIMTMADGWRGAMAWPATGEVLGLSKKSAWKGALK